MTGLNTFSQKVVIIGGFILIPDEAFFIETVFFKCPQAVKNSQPCNALQKAFGCAEEKEVD